MEMDKPSKEQLKERHDVVEEFLRSHGDEMPDILQGTEASSNAEAKTMDGASAEQLKEKHDVVEYFLHRHGDEIPDVLQGGDKPGNTMGKTMDDVSSEQLKIKQDVVEDFLHRHGDEVPDVLQGADKPGNTVEKTMDDVSAEQLKIKQDVVEDFLHRHGDEIDGVRGTPEGGVGGTMIDDTSNVTSVDATDSSPMAENKSDEVDTSDNTDEGGGRSNLLWGAIGMGLNVYASAMGVQAIDLELQNAMTPVCPPIEQQAENNIETNAASGICVSPEEMEERAKKAAGLEEFSDNLQTGLQELVEAINKRQKDKNAIEPEDNVTITWVPPKQKQETDEAENDIS